MLTREEIDQIAYAKLTDIEYVSLHDEIVRLARETAIDFHDWQKKDQAECLADMSTEDYFDKYLKSKQ